MKEEPRYLRINGQPIRVIFDSELSNIKTKQGKVWTIRRKLSQFFVRIADKLYPLV